MMLEPVSGVSFPAPAGVGRQTVYGYIKL